MSEQIIDQDQPQVLVIAPAKKLFIESLCAFAVLNLVVLGVIAAIAYFSPPRPPSAASPWTVAALLLTCFALLFGWLLVTYYQMAGQEWHLTAAGLLQRRGTTDTAVPWTNIARFRKRTRMLVYFETKDGRRHELNFVPPQVVDAALRWIAANDERRGEPSRNRPPAPGPLDPLLLWLPGFVIFEILTIGIARRFHELEFWSMRGSLVLFGLAQVLIGLPIVAVTWLLLRSSAKLEQQSRDQDSIEARAGEPPP
jgi:hypothetical protein